MHKGYSAPCRFRLRPLTRCLLGAAVLSWSAAAAALGLGELSLHSGLNQPFNADIDLIDSAGLGPEDLRVSLASPEAFAKAGMERAFFLSDLRFTPVAQGGRMFIHVHSTKALVEPYLNFMVQVDRPGGQVLRGYTLLIDPPGTVALAPARIPTGAAPSHPPAGVDTATAAPPERAKAPPELPAASEGKQYRVEKGDTLWTIGKKLQPTGTPNQLVRDIRALNPKAVPLKVGQSLLLPDTAVLPGAPTEASDAVRAPVANVPAPAPAASAPAADMAASVLNQQLQQNLDELQGKVKALESQVADKNQQVAMLQGQLANRPAPAPSPVTAAPVASRPATPSAPAPAPAAPVASPADNTWMLQLAALLLVVLLLGVLWWRRRQAAQAPDVAVEPYLPEVSPPPANAGPAISPYHAPAAATLAAVAEETAPAPRKAAPATDALDGASIYIAYGRFNEALGILREGVRREPEREDLRVKILEVLAQQGDAQAYAAQEQAMREQGVPARELEQVRERFPKIALAMAASAAATATLMAHATPEPDATQAALPELDEPERQADAGPVEDDLATLDLSDLPELDALDGLDGLATLPGEAPAEPASTEGEFHLNLEDLSLDTDWASVDPFDSPAKRALEVTAAPVEAPLAPAEDLGFASNLSEFPEVFELSEEHYLGELGATEDAVEKVNEFDASALDLEVGDTFDKTRANAELPALPDLDDLPDLDALSLDFDAIDTQQQAAEKLEQARQLIGEGDNGGASRLLYELLREGDPASRDDARALLAKLEG